MLELYKNIKRIREEKGMSQEELARLVGFKSRSSINKIEMGVNDITQSKLVAIANALGVSPGELMGVDEPASPAPPAAPEKPHKPQLTDKDERDIQKKLSNILDGLDSEAGLAYYNGDEPMDEETRELLRLSLENSLRMAKLRAKERFTPKKYWNKSAQTPDDTATRIGKKVLDASPAAQAAVSEIIRDDEKDK